MHDVFERCTQSNQNLLFVFKQRESKRILHTRRIARIPILVTTQELDGYIEGTSVGPVVESGCLASA
jgi:hypothetical protein